MYNWHSNSFEVIQLQVIKIKKNEYNDEIKSNDENM